MGTMNQKPATSPLFAVTGIAISGNDSVYVNRDGGKAVAAVVAKVTLADVTFDATIYATLKDGSMTFKASLPRKGVSFGQSVKDAMIETAENAVADWSGWSDAADRAEKVLTSPGKLASTSKLQAKASKLAPKLVAKVETVEPVSEPAK